MNKDMREKPGSSHLDEINFDLGADIHPRLEQMKSVRSTFNLSKLTLETLEKFSKQREITVKETFNEISKHKKVLIRLAESIKEKEDKSQDKKNNSKRVRKTMVISNSALNIFSNVAKDHNISRDSLIDLSIMLLDKSMKDYRESHKKASKLFSKFTDAAYSLSSQLNKLLGGDDPITFRMGYVILFIDHLNSAIELEQADGTPIDPENYYG